MSIIRIRDEHGNVREVTAIKGDKGDSYILTEADKQEIAGIVANMAGVISDSPSLTEEQVLALIQANMPPSGDGESY